MPNGKRYSATKDQEDQERTQQIRDADGFELLFSRGVDVHLGRAPWGLGSGLELHLAPFFVAFFGPELGGQPILVQDKLFLDPHLLINIVRYLPAVLCSVGLQVCA